MVRRGNSSVRQGAAPPSNVKLRDSTEELLDLEIIQMALALRSLREYVRQSWAVIEPETPFIPGFHIDAICDHLEAVVTRQIKRLVINVPPRHTKSIVTSVCFPTWAWIDPQAFDGTAHHAQPRGPHLRFLCASYAQSIATRDALRSRRVLESSWYQARWGKHFEITSDQNEKMRYENDRTGYRIATSVGGSATGEGGDLLLIDDPHKIEEGSSETIRQQVLDWFDQVWSTRLNDPNRSAMVIIMQRLHEHDLTSHVLARGGWERLTLPTEYRPTSYATAIGFTDPRREPGALLNPQRFGPEAVAQAKRDLGVYGYAGQHQQEPAPLEGGRVKRVWFRYWHRPGTDPGPVAVRTADGIMMVPSVSVPDRWDDLIQSWDMTFKDSDHGMHRRRADVDFVAGGLWGRQGADKYLLDVEHDRMDFPTTLARFRAFCHRYPESRAKLVEDTANGPAIIATLRHEISGIVPVKPQGGKAARLAAVSAQIEAGNVYLPHPAQCAWTENVIYEMTAFPRAAHDDLCLPAETVITVKRAGFVRVVPIARVTRGDLVLSHRGQWRRVLRRLERPYKGELVVVQARGAPRVALTPNHPILVKRNTSRWRSRLYPSVEAAACWIPAGEIAPGDVAIDPRPGRTRSHQSNRVTPAGTERRITRIERRQYDGPVFNLEVEMDRSYTTGAFVVHNCDMATQALLRIEKTALPLWGFDVRTSKQPDRGASFQRSSADAGLPTPPGEALCVRCSHLDRDHPRPACPGFTLDPVDAMTPEQRYELGIE